MPSDTPAVRAEGIASPSFAVSFSSGIRRLRHVSQFLSVTDVVSPFDAIRRSLPVSSVVVWGRKQNSQRALAWARANHLPVQYIEDGWIRSCSADAHSRVCYSLLVDDVGVYYDAGRPSALENWLNQSDDVFDRECDASALARAASCRQRLIDAGITKYNFCPDPDPASLQGCGKPLVLVLDQTRDDVSVTLGGLDEAAFVAMLQRAVAENPEARVVVRTHPDVVSGRRQGYLDTHARRLGLEVSASADNPIAWLRRADTVYAGTSQLGYEALLCGCRVKVAGKPFYAGWGLTEDWQSFPQRKARRTLDQLFHATHLRLARYCCPVSGRPWTLEQCLDHVELQKTCFRRNAGNKVGVGITPWKKRYLAQFLRSPHGRLRFSSRDDAGVNEIPLYWSYTDRRPRGETIAATMPVPLSESDATTEVAPEDGAGSATENASASDYAPIGRQRHACIRIEDGFIRSRGLGSDFVAPASLVFDDSGLYFDAGGPSRLERLLNDHDCSDEELQRAACLRQAILAANLTKYNVGRQDVEPAPRLADGVSRKRILVIGQVEGDQSLLRGGREIRTNGSLLMAVRKAESNAFIVYKPHPDVVSGNRRGDVASGILNSCVDRVETERHFTDCLNDCDELHTITSLSGFEALMRGIRVVTYGMPFYAGWGLTVDTQCCERRHRRRSIDELVYLALVAYPHYVDLDSGEFITPEQLICKLVDTADVEGAGRRPGGRFRWMNKVINVCGAMAYRA